MTVAHPAAGPVPWTTVAPLVEEIYAGRWYSRGASLSAHADAFRADAAALLRLNLEPRRVEVLASQGVEDEAEALWARLLQRRGLLRFRSPMVAPGTRWGGPPAGTGPAAVDHGSNGSRTLTAAVDGSDGVRWTLWLERAPGREPFGRLEAELLETLVPHWRRVLALQDAVDDLTARMQAATEIMNHSPTGIITLSALGRILFANEEARRIFQQADGVVVADDRILVEDGRCRRLYEAALTRLIAGSASPELPFCLLHVPRPSGQLPYQLCVVSRPDPEAAIPALRPAVFVYLRDLQPARLPQPGQLHALYGLTTAEASLCQLLYQGTPLQDAARSLGISLNTAKTHRRQAYRKIGVSSQAQLIQRLIMQYWGPAAGDDGPATGSPRLRP